MKTLNESIEELRQAGRDFVDVVLDTSLGRMLIRFLDWLGEKLG